MAKPAWVEPDRPERDSSDPRGATAESVSRSPAAPQRTVSLHPCRGEFSESRRFRKLI